jgi:hypothetical protein
MPIIMKQNNQHNLHIIFRKNVVVPGGLTESINQEVARLVRRRRIEMRVSAVLTSTVSLAALAVAGREIAVEAAASGFSTYAALAFTDGGAMLSDWHDFAWTLAESAPIWGVGLSLGAGAILVGAIHWTRKTFRGTAFAV